MYPAMYKVPSARAFGAIRRAAMAVFALALSPFGAGQASEVRCDAPEHVEEIISFLQTPFDEAYEASVVDGLATLPIEVDLVNVVIEELDRDLRRSLCQATLILSYDGPLWALGVGDGLHELSRLHGSRVDYVTQYSMASNETLYRVGQNIIEAVEATQSLAIHEDWFSPPAQAFRWDGESVPLDPGLLDVFTDANLTVPVEFLKENLGDEMRGMLGDDYRDFMDGLHVASAYRGYTPYLVMLIGNARGLGGIVESALAVDLWTGTLHGAYMGVDGVKTYQSADAPMPYLLHQWVMMRATSPLDMPTRELSEDCAEIAHAVRMPAATHEAHMGQGGEPATMDNLPTGIPMPERIGELHDSFDGRSAGRIALIDINNDGTLDWWVAETAGAKFCTKSAYALMGHRDADENVIEPLSPSTLDSFDDRLAFSYECGFIPSWKFVENTVLMELAFSDGYPTMYHLFQDDTVQTCRMPD